MERIINTRALVLLDDSSGKDYIHLFDGFVEATALTGPWKVAKNVPSGVNTLARRLAKERVVDLMEGSADEKNPKKKPSLRKAVPGIIVVTAPTELIATEGKPDWAPLDRGGGWDRDGGGFGGRGHSWSGGSFGGFRGGGRR